MNRTGPARHILPGIALTTVLLCAVDVARAEDGSAIGDIGQAAFTVVVRDENLHPIVIRNAPLLDDGTPMPTRYWLVGAPERAAVARLETAGGVRRAEGAVSRERLAQAHDVYAAERDRALPAGYPGPRPSGGVGGTRKGVKCLHAHYAWYLAGGDDPVGRWVADQLASESGRG